MKRESLSYVFPIAVCAAIVLWQLLYPAVPALVSALIRFPPLASATYLEGKFEYEGERQQQRYFVVNTNGRHEFECGAVGARRQCFNTPERYKGHPAKVWYSFWYGSIQHELTVAVGNKAHPLDEVVYRYSEAAANARLLRARPINYWIVVLLSLFMAWLITKEVWRREELEKNLNDVNDMANISIGTCSHQQEAALPRGRPSPLETAQTASPIPTIPPHDPTQPRQ